MMVYLDNAATTFPKPRSVQEAAAKALYRFGANPGRAGHQMSLSAAEEVYRCRCAAAPRKPPASAAAHTLSKHSTRKAAARA